MAIINVLIVDDHIKVRTQISNRLSREVDLMIIGQVGSKAEIYALPAEFQPDVVLIDPEMNDCEGLAGLELIRDNFPEAHVVVLTAVADTAMQVELRKIGVNRVLSKGVESQRLIQTIREAVVENA
jgi:DNA-binding NarL/FixJ family response regulator